MCWNTPWILTFIKSFVMLGSMMLLFLLIMVSSVIVISSDVSDNYSDTCNYARGWDLRFKSAKRGDIFLWEWNNEPWKSTHKMFVIQVYKTGYLLVKWWFVHSIVSATVISARSKLWSHNYFRVDVIALTLL